MTRLALIAVVLLIGVRVEATSCILQPVGLGCGAAIRSHAAIFIGKRISASHVLLGSDAGKFTGWYWQTTLEVRERFGGNIGNQVVIFTPASAPARRLPDGTITMAVSSGEFSFDPDKDYLVIADEDGGRLFTGVCSGTTLVDNAQQTINDLRHLPIPGTASVRGP